MPSKHNFNLIWCNDSPGWGGSEKSMLRVVGFLHSNAINFTFILNPEAHHKLKNALRVYGQSFQTFFTNAAARFFISGLLKSARLSFRNRSGVFIIWCHHVDSNRWLQLWLALAGRTFVLIERSVPADVSSFKHSKLSIPVKRFVIRRAAAVALPGNSAAQQYTILFGKPKELYVIPNSRPVISLREEVDRLRTAKEKNYPYHGKVICTVGRLHASKNLMGLIQAFAQVQSNHPCSLLIVGDGEEEEALKSVVHRLGLKHVYFTGYKDQINTYLAQADVFVSNSLLEGLPGALIEAMAAGLPCIATDIPGNRELVHHMKTGLQVPVNNPQALAEAINTYLVNHQLAEAHASNGFNWVLDTYAIEQEKIKWLQLVADLQQ